jgi:hypothetical protein
MRIVHVSTVCVSAVCVCVSAVCVMHSAVCVSTVATGQYSAGQYSTLVPAGGVRWDSKGTSAAVTLS